MRADDLAAIAVKGALERVPQLDRSLIEDLILGCAFPEGEQGFNLARLVVALAGLPETVGGVTVNRFCASSLQAFNMAAQNIMLAAHALGYGAMWKTGDPAYDPRVKRALGLEESDAIVAFLYLGTNTGQLYASADEGERWRLLTSTLPPISSVSVTVLE